MSIITTVLMDQPQDRVTLIYGNRDRASIIFRDAILGLKDLYLDRLQVIHLLTREGQAVPLLNGRITDSKLRELDRDLLGVKAYDDAFVCGPQPMTLQLRETLIELGLDSSRVHVELYGSHVPATAAATTTSDPADAVDIDITVNGSRRRVSGHRSQSVLSAATDAGLDVPFSCTGGVCATCRAHLVDGSVAMTVNYSLQQWELDAGFVLTCQARPTSRVLTLDYDAI
jgi:ring-1,2-phenylacetyl-CoA epoxidase subunit PaaE